jgi:hypothetical protein
VEGTNEAAEVGPAIEAESIEGEGVRNCCTSLLVVAREVSIVGGD